MATQDPEVRREAASLHREHEELMGRLDQLDSALEQIVCYSEIFTDLATANQAASSGKWMAEWLPRHYAREETTVLETIARMSPELASFAREMKHQHKELRLRLENFRELISHPHEASDLELAVAELKRQGKDFTRLMRLHMSAEDQKFGSLEN